MHSLKDLPAELPDGLVVGAVLPREDPGDVLVSRDHPVSVPELPEGARVGTGSIRRGAALLKVRPDLQVVELKGNVPTRLRRLEEGDFDAIVLAAAGLNRLGRSPRGLHPIDPTVMPPALCQGVVAVEVRGTDARAPWIAALNHPVTMTATRAERALLTELEVGCGAPVGGLASVQGTRVTLFGEVLSPDGSRWVREVAEGRVAEAATVGRAVGQALLTGAAADLLKSLRS